MVVDVERCGGCRTCTVACNLANGTPPGVSWCTVVTGESGEYPNPRVTETPRQCLQCADPPCVAVCPTGASAKRPDGIVAGDAESCSSCGDCVDACPHGMRQITDVRPYRPEIGFTAFEEGAYAKRHPGVPEKCDDCLELVVQGRQPVCVAACPSHARRFGDLDDPDSEVSRIPRRRRAY